MTLFMLMTIVVSINCCFMNHPLTLGFSLLLQTIIVALFTGYMSLNFWSSYIIFLIMIGGLLILFTYMTSIASNEKFKFSFKLLLLNLVLFLIMLIPTFMDKLLIFPKIKFLETFYFNSNMKIEFFLNKFINFPHNMIYLLIVIYLLITMIAVVKITLKTKSTLRKKF
uniref:NADH-ubiquinone oxidoreductase chain 6 n=1 Tax=Cryptocephalus moraei TaxID=204949 RepID=A0A3G1GQY0_9CUCU|nr:NADH dehydrogenase subunit 6 [Cryptocephalus moraei]